MSAIKIEHLPQYKIEDYRRWKGDWELIRGIPYAMSPSANITHQRILRKLVLKVHTALDNQKCSCEVFFELDLILDENSVVRPDLMVISDKVDSEYPQKAPSLIAEIISPSSKSTDRTTKFDLYQGYGVKNYLIVDPDKKTIQAYQLENGRYLEKSLHGGFTLKGCQLELGFSDIFE